MDYKDDFFVPILMIALVLVLNLTALLLSRQRDAALSTTILLSGVFWILLQKRR